MSLYFSTDIFSVQSAPFVYPHERENKAMSRCFIKTGKARQMYTFTVISCLLFGLNSMDVSVLSHQRMVEEKQKLLLFGEYAVCEHKKTLSSLSVLSWAVCVWSSKQKWITEYVLPVLVLGFFTSALSSCGADVCFSVWMCE